MSPNRTIARRSRLLRLLHREMPRREILRVLRDRARQRRRRKRLPLKVRVQRLPRVLRQLHRPMLQQLPFRSVRRSDQPRPPRRHSETQPLPRTRARLPNSKRLWKEYQFFAAGRSLFSCPTRALPMLPGAHKRLRAPITSLVTRLNSLIARLRLRPMRFPNGSVPKPKQRRRSWPHPLNVRRARFPLGSK